MIQCSLSCLLQFRGLRFGTEGAASLAQLLPHTKLCSVHLHGLKDGQHGIGAEGAGDICAALSQIKATTLLLPCNRLGVDGAAARLIPSLPATGIKHLSLASNLIKDSEICSLAAVIPLTQLHTLNLEANRVSAAGASALAKALPHSSIATLLFSSNQIGTAGCSALARTLSKTSLTYLDLSGNKLGPDGAEALAASLVESQVQYLNLKHNQLSCAGVAAFASVFQLANTALTCLNLASNQVRDKGTKALASALCSTISVTSIDFGFNSITDVGVAAICKALPECGALVRVGLEECLDDPTTNRWLECKCERRDGVPWVSEINVYGEFVGFKVRKSNVCRVQA